MTIRRFRPMPPDDKRTYNQQLFNVVAPRYDLITRILSFNRDAAWKSQLVRRLPAQTYRICLDLACGTGDLTLAVADRFSDAEVYGIDITPAMIELANRRNVHPRVHFAEGDMNALTWGDESLDLITGGYALRNAPDLHVALQECYRVLRSGGVAAFLDFSKPASRLAQRVEYGVLKFWGCLWGLVLHGNPAVYGYIAETLADFPDRDSFRGLLEKNGFAVVESIRFFGLFTEVLICRKNGSGVA